MKNIIIACLFALTAAVACSSGGSDGAKKTTGATSQPASQPAK